MNQQTKRILVLRDSVNPSFAYAFLGFTIFFWIWTAGAYSVTRDLQEPILIRSIAPYYSIIDSNSYLLLLSVSIIVSIVTLCCFRFGHKKAVKNV